MGSTSGIYLKACHCMLDFGRENVSFVIDKVEWAWLTMGNWWPFAICLGAIIVFGKSFQCGGFTVKGKVLLILGSFIRPFCFWSGSHDDGVAVDQFQYSCLQTANIIVSDPASFAFLRGGAGGSNANKGKKKVNLLIQSVNEVIEKLDVKFYNMNRRPILLHPT